MKQLFDVIGTISLGVGFFFAFLLHATHVGVGFGGIPHTKHILIGILFVVIGLGVLVYNNKALKILR